MILIKGGRVIDPRTKTDELMDVLVEDDRVSLINKKIEIKDGMDVIDAEGMFVCPGLIDVHCHFRDPGQTYKEDIRSGSMVAAVGGYTTVICMANTIPVVDNVDTLGYIINKAKEAPIDVFQAASVTMGLLGSELTPMEELKNSGAVGFTDDGKAIISSKVLRDAFLKASDLDLPISLHEEDSSLISENGINSDIAHYFGIKGSPKIAEESMVARDVTLAIETGAKVNFQHLSSKKSIELIGWAKKYSNNIFAEATPHHLCLNQEALLKKGSNTKMNPPLRGEEDRIALIEGLVNGTIDIIATDHAPHSRDEKNKNILTAPSGIIGLETALSLCYKNLVKKGFITMIKLLEKFTINPARLYKLDCGVLREGAKADIILFDPKEEWVYDNTLSKSTNSPFLGETMEGRVIMTLKEGKIVYKKK